MTDRDKLIEDLTHEAWLRDADATDLSDIRSGVMLTIAALEANGLVVVPGWQSIESAPRETPVLLFCPENSVDEKIVMGEQYGQHDIWRVHIDGQGIIPTHWMPLPAAPNEGEG